MTGKKCIRLGYGPSVYRNSITINSAMTEEEIYQSILATVPRPLRTQPEVAVADNRGKLAQLQYVHLKGRGYYMVTPSSERRHAVGAVSERTAHAINAVLENREIDGDARIIFPASIAPREKQEKGELAIEGMEAAGSSPALREPRLWAKNFAKELKSLSNTSKGRHAEAIVRLERAVEARKAKYGVATPAEVTRRDLTTVKESWGGGGGG